MSKSLKADGSGDPLVNVYDNNMDAYSISIREPYDGPVTDLEHQYIAVTSDNLRIAAAAPNSFIHGGDGNDAISVTSGNKALEGGRGSNFLVGGTGNDTFFFDFRDPTASIWSTIVNFHSGDTAIIWVKPGDPPVDVSYGGASLAGREPHR